MEKKQNLTIAACGKTIDNSLFIVLNTLDYISNWTFDLKEVHYTIIGINPLLMEHRIEAIQPMGEWAHEMGIRE